MPATQPSSVTGNGVKLAGNPPGTVTRVYDIRDLIVQVPDFDNPPQLGIHALLCRAIFFTICVSSVKQ